MDIINVYKEGRKHSTDPQKRKASRRKYLHNRTLDAKEYMVNVHKFELYKVNDGTGVFRIMTGREAKTLNERYRKEYIDHVNHMYPDRAKIPLRRWVVVDRLTQEELTQEESDKLRLEEELEAAGEYLPYPGYTGTTTNPSLEEKLSSHISNLRQTAKTLKANRESQEDVAAKISWLSEEADKLESFIRPEETK